MLLTLLIIFLVRTVLFFILTVLWQSLALGIVTTVLWFILSISIYSIEIPYQYITSGDVVGTGVHTIQTMYSYGWIFILMGFITAIYVFADIVFPMLQQKFSRMM